MYARIATFEGATDIRGAVAGMEQGGPPEGLKATEAYFFADAASGKSIFVTFFETEEDMKAGDAMLNAMSPGDVGVGSRVERRPHGGPRSHDGLAGGARDQHVLEVLAGAAAGAAVHVPAQPRLEPQPGPVEDLRVEVAAVVDDDEHRRARPQRRRGVRERGRDPGAVRLDRRA